MATLAANQTRLLATVLCTVAFAYVVWKITQSPEQALQFTFNGLSVGAVYALLAIGFTLVYSTVWFFDLYYGAAAALGAYGVFYLRSQQAVGGQYEVNSLAVNIIFGALVAGVVAWALHEGVRPRLQQRCSPRLLRWLGGALAAATGVYTGVILAHPDELHLLLAPVVGLATAVAVGWLIYRVALRVRRRIDPGADLRGMAIAGIGPGRSWAATAGWRWPARPDRRSTSAGPSPACSPRRWASPSTAASTSTCASGRARRSSCSSRRWACCSP